MRLTFNRWLPARIICWLIQKLGFAIMLYPDHFGHQAGDVEFDLRTKNKPLLYLAGIIPNRALYEMHKRYATIIGVPNWVRVHLIEAHITFDCLDEALSRDLVFYGNAEVWRGEPRMTFSEEEDAYGQELLRKLRLEAGKYVCFHARDSMYANLHHPEVIAKRKSKHLESLVNLTEDHPFQKHRNVDFGLYFRAIDWLETQGLKAVRLGSYVDQCYAHHNLVDYGCLRTSIERPDLADLYLMAHCKLYVGHGSGVTQMSSVWNTPAVCVNWFPYHQASRPSANVTDCRVKRLKIGDEVLSEFHTRHFFEAASWLQIYNASADFEVVDNTPREILETVQKALGEKAQRRAA